ncbi:hypothetical protein [Streptomyces sp. H51]|uniref:hypothetical protein n=1 Tax=Streptomyces sp. H51 TaxID=3111770 RepID=UPI002D78AE91|nr:hypothetical protein [Streptomyces sp. H51]
MSHVLSRAGAAGRSSATLVTGASSGSGAAVAVARRPAVEWWLMLLGGLGTTRLGAVAEPARGAAPAPRRRPAASFDGR